MRLMRFSPKIHQIRAKNQFFRSVLKSSPTQIGFVGVVNLEPNISCLGPFIWFFSLSCMGFQPIFLISRNMLLFISVLLITCPLMLAVNVLPLWLVWTLFIYLPTSDLSLMIVFLTGLQVVLPLPSCLELSLFIFLPLIFVDLSLIIMSGSRNSNETRPLMLEPLISKTLMGPNL